MKFELEVPSLKRKQEAIEYINEFTKYNSQINGAGGLNRYLQDYEGWLEKLEQDYTRIPSETKVPTRTYFLIRKSDNKIIGMINIRLALNEKLRKFGGNIGYSIRPTERTLQDKVPCSQNAASMGGSQIWLDTREELTVDEMLKAMCVVSANDYDVQFKHE